MTDPLEMALRRQLATLRVDEDPTATERMITVAEAAPPARGLGAAGRVPYAPVAAAAAVVVVAGGVTLLATGNDGTPTTAADGPSVSASPSSASTTTYRALPNAPAPSSSVAPRRPTTFTLHLDVPVGRARTVEHGFAAMGRQFTVLRIRVVDPRQDAGILDVSGGNTFVLKSYRLQNVRNRDLPQTDLIHIVRGAPLQVSIECTSAPTGRCVADVRITGYSEASFPAPPSTSSAAPSAGLTLPTNVPSTSTAPTPSQTAPSGRRVTVQPNPTASPTRTCSPTTSGPGC